ncbi:unnamed protein product [Laminaria digitata]
MRPWTTLGLVASIGVGFQKHEGHAFTSPSVRCPMPRAMPQAMPQVKAANRHRQRTRPRVVVQNSFRPSEAVTSAATAAVKLALAGDGKASPIYRQMVVLALRWATEEVGRYFKPEKPDKTAADQRSPRERREYARIQAKGLQSRLGPAVDIVLSPADDKKNALAMTELLDRLEEESGMGATLALGILDTVWSLPAPVRPEIGEWVISAVYEALRRYGVFTRYGALSPPDKQMPQVEKPAKLLLEDMEDTPAFNAAKFGLTSKVSLAYCLLSCGLLWPLAAYYANDRRERQTCFIRSLCLSFVLQEVLHGALFNAVIQLLQPDLTELTSVHEAGHVTVAYLAGCPISTYTLGGVASLRHGDELGCGPSCNIINPELSAARTTLPDDNNTNKAMLRAGDQKAPDSRQTAELELSYRYAAQHKRPRGDSSGWRELRQVDRSSELNEANARAAQWPQNGRHATANRYALSAMGGVVGETLVNGFGLGGQADLWDLRRTLRILWPSISEEDLRSTETWALVEGLRVLKEDRESIQLVAKNMRECREIGRVLLHLERTLTAEEFDCTYEA